MLVCVCGGGVGGWGGQELAEFSIIYILPQGPTVELCTGNNISLATFNHVYHKTKVEWSPRGSDFKHSLAWLHSSFENMFLI